MLPLPDYHLIVRVKLSTHKCSKCWRKKNDLLHCDKSICYRIVVETVRQKSVQKSLFWPYKSGIFGWNDFEPQDCNHWQRKLQTMNFTVDFASNKWTRILAFIILLVLSLWTRKVSSFRYKCDSDFALEAKEINGNVSFYAFNWGWEEQFTSINNPEKTSVNVTKCNRMSNIKGLCNICLLI